MKMLPFFLLSLFLLVGCGKPDLDGPENLDQILSEAIDADKIQQRGKEGEELAYAPNSQTPYTGWVKEIYSNGQVEVLRRYKGGQTAFEAKWLEDGQREMEANYKDGKQHGLVTGWYENGQKAWEHNYKDGKKHGLIRGWYENGQKSFETNFKDGKRMTASAWKPDGSKCPLTSVKDGNGVRVFYYENGQKFWKNNYKDGKRHGLVTGWHENGQKRLETNYKDGKRHGPMTAWDNNGKVIRQKKWKNGVQVE